MLKKIIKNLLILSHLTCLSTDLKIAPGYHDQTKIIKMRLIDFISLPASYNFSARYAYCQNKHAYHQSCINKTAYCSYCGSNLVFNLDIIAIQKIGFDSSTTCTGCNKTCIK